MTMTTTTRNDTVETLRTPIDASYVWLYESLRGDLADLYARAKRSQWDGASLAWSTDVDPERENTPDSALSIWGSPLWERLTPRERARLRREWASWMFSQFMHGEQGALLAASQLVTMVPSIDGKLYGGTQVVDEARHVEVFERFLREKIGKTYPVNAHLKTLLDLILTDSRWDMKFLGMQVMVEGLALASFAMIHNHTRDGFGKSLLHNVMRDEARHVAYGVLSLRDFYADLGEHDRRERQDFCYEAAVLMRDRLLGSEVYATMGLPVAECDALTLRSPSMIEFRRLLFSRIVPSLRRLGLLTGVLRERFAALDLLVFEDWPIEEVEG